MRAQCCSLDFAAILPVLHSTCCARWPANLRHVSDCRIIRAVTVTAAPAPELETPAPTVALLEPEPEPQPPAAASIAKPAALVLGPTRELCQQIAGVAEAVAAGLEGGFAVACVVGGVDYMAQRAWLERSEAGRAGGPAMVAVATVGRLLALCGVVPASTRSRNANAVADAPVVDLSSVCHLVLDEADRMLDMGCVSNQVSLRPYSLLNCPLRSQLRRRHPRAARADCGER